MPRRRELSRQFVRFVAVGASNTVVSYAAYATLVTLGLPYLPAGAAAFAAGAVNGYRLNRRWTFETSDTLGLRLRYVLVQLRGLASTSLLLGFLVEGARLDRITAYGVTIPIVTLATFTANRGWVFAVRRTLPREAPLAR